MNSPRPMDISYYPGCSLASTATENNQSLLALCRKMGLNLIELEDWNCCGSSSAHALNEDLALDLAARNLFKAPPDRPLLVACPNCILRLRSANLELCNNEIKRYQYEKKWGMPFNTDLKILHFFELFNDVHLPDLQGQAGVSLEGLKFAPYYGCMLSRPNTLKHVQNYHGLMEAILASLGASPISWNHSSRCCGTFLAVTKPEITTKIVNRIMEDAIDAGADCLVTACAMCHLNLEIRCGLKNPLPTMHFSELLSLALGVRDPGDWFSKHLVDPRPLLKRKALLR